jgi:excisionase family DNA binding protein
MKILNEMPGFTGNKNAKHLTLWLNTKEVAKALGVTTRTVQNYRDQGMLPFSQIGRVIRYRDEDVQDFLMTHYVEPSNWKGGVL